MNKEEIQQQIEVENNNLLQVRNIMSKPEVTGDEYEYYLNEEMRILANISYLEKDLDKESEVYGD